MLHDGKKHLVMQQFYYLAVLFVAGGIGSALIVAADLRTRRQPMRIMESVWVLTALWASFFGLWAYFAFGRAARHMPVQNDGTGKQKGLVKISEPAKGGGIGENGNERKVGSAGQETENRKPGTGRRKDLSVAGTDPWKVSEPEPAMNMPEPAMTGMQMENGTTTEADGAEDMPGMKGTAGKTDTADKADIPGMTNRVDMPGMADRADMPGMTNEPNMSGTMEGMDGMGNMPGMKGRPRWQSVVLSTLHCGAGCTLADIVGEWFLFFVPVAIGGSILAGTWVVDYLLALAFGIGFQYAAIRGMERTLPRCEAIRRAAKADILSLTAWQAGMYGWMAVAIFALNGGEAMPRTSFVFWFTMQIAMACGFLVALPVNILLIRAGIKKGCSRTASPAAGREIYAALPENSDLIVTFAPTAEKPQRNVISGIHRKTLWKQAPITARQPACAGLTSPRTPPCSATSTYG